MDIIGLSSLAQRPLLWPGCPVTRPDLREIEKVREALLASGHQPLAIHCPWSIVAGDAAGKAPLVEVVDGVKLNWREHPHSRRRLFPATRCGANTGLVLGGAASLIALDIDPSKKASAAEQQRFALDILRLLYGDRRGPALRSALLRLRNPASALLLLRATTAMTKIKVAGERGAVELLGEGQQFVCHGLHPNSLRGDPVRWAWRDGRAPWIVPADGLPVIPARDLRILMDRIASSGVLGVPVARPASSTTVITRSGRATAYPATARLNALFDCHNGLVMPAVRDLIKEIGREGCGRHDALIAICGRLVMQGWSDERSLRFLVSFVNESFHEGDWTGEVEAALGHARTRQNARLQSERRMIWKA